MDNAKMMQVAKHAGMTVERVQEAFQQGASHPDWHTVRAAMLAVAQEDRAAQKPPARAESAPKGSYFVGCE